MFVAFLYYKYLINAWFKYLGLCDVVQALDLERLHMRTSLCTCTCINTDSRDTYARAHTQARLPCRCRISRGCSLSAPPWTCCASSSRSSTHSGLHLFTMLYLCMYNVPLNKNMECAIRMCSTSCSNVQKCADFGHQDAHASASSPAHGTCVWHMHTFTCATYLAGSASSSWSRASARALQSTHSLPRCVPNSRRTSPPRSLRYASPTSIYSGSPNTHIEVHAMDMGFGLLTASLTVAHIT